MPPKAKPKAEPSDLPIHPFRSAKEFEHFLEREHLTAPGIYLKLAKKNSGIASVSRDEAVETALCFGWIDGRANAYDEDWWLVRYTPRRAKSIWSKKNVMTVESLVKAGRMRPAGLAVVEAAKADGRWGRAYDGPASITVPDDLATALASKPPAAAFFESLNRSDRYSLLVQLQWAAPQRREKRIETLVRMLADGKTPGTSLKAKSTILSKSKTAERTSKKGSVRKATKKT
ncbi:bacteriocin-protection, YdeI or OmpD-associated-domain-containing protein [Aspergillus alliaceus]|nr:bacteriocin-protection, YdeI or OmpD-associated-domain-containing protein [Aspergillus alliaceus]KAB8230905.1 bacteriocin-protection, YdeI or OmpD-associated-domain-containing protein [Aspergillus alliaceus]KAE8390127.1 bacteriocin-protection, YdeI or OmpD-associated-domain-containing protein [Aspergillus alliaceus]